MGGGARILLRGRRWGVGGWGALLGSNTPYLACILLGLSKKAYRGSSTGAGQGTWCLPQFSCWPVVILAV